MQHKDLLLFALLSIFTISLNGSEQLCAAVRKSLGNATFPLFQKFLDILNTKAPDAQLTYNHPLLTIKHNGTLKNTNDLEGRNDWYALKIDSSDATTTVMRFEYIAANKKPRQ